MPTNLLPVGPREFDVRALFDALDERRLAEGLTWTGVADGIWRQSAELNDRRSDHPIAPATITGMPRRRDTTCQHALFMLRWLGAAPEDFIAAPRPATIGVPLPEADPAHRLRWSLIALHTALNAARAERGETWEQAARRLTCSPNQLVGLRTAKFGTGLRLAMRICQSLDRPAADFVHLASWQPAILVRPILHAP